MKNITCFVLLLLVSLHAIGANDVSGETLYKKGQYQEAATEYEKMLSEGESAALLYNIGNCYYKLNNWGKAILYYEKALVHSPTDADVLFNLTMANGHTSDKVVTRSPGIKKWFFSQLMIVQPDIWSYSGLGAGLVAFLLLLLARLRSKRVYRVAGRWMLLPFILMVLFGWLLNNHLNSRSQGIILEPSVDVKTAPGNNAKAAFILHEGTKVTVNREKQGWMEITFDNDQKGWIEKSALGII